MEGLMFPKTMGKKKRKKHKKSILHKKDGTCYLCMMLHEDYRIHPVLHEHHIFGGANRKHSEEYGLKVNLCIPHHETGKEAAHQNAEVAELLHRKGQAAFEKAYPELDFREIFGKNYL